MHIGTLGVFYVLFGEGGVDCWEIIIDENIFFFVDCSFFVHRLGWCLKLYSAFLMTRQFNHWAES